MNNDVSLNTKISNLDLSTRVKNVLQRNKITIVLDLLNIDLNDLRDMRYLGDNSIGELLEFCKLHHIPIGDKETYEKMKNSPIIEEKKEVKDIIKEVLLEKDIQMNELQMAIKENPNLLVDIKILEMNLKNIDPQTISIRMDRKISYVLDLIHILDTPEFEEIKLFFKDKNTELVNLQFDYKRILNEELVNLEKECVDEQVLRNLKILDLRKKRFTLAEIGDQFSITRERVRQIIFKCVGQDLEDFLKNNEIEKQSLDKEIINEKINSIVEYVKINKGISITELLNEFDTDMIFFQKFIPKNVSKFVLTDYKSSNGPTKIWNNEDIIECLKSAGTYFFPLSHGDYEKLVEIGEIKGPSVPLIYKRFGSWTNACQKAGIETNKPVRSEYVLDYSDEEILIFLMRYFNEEHTIGSIEDYEKWRRAQNGKIPSIGLIRNRIGNWGIVKEIVLKKMSQIES
jgi:hypothetical protein